MTDIYEPRDNCAVDDCQQRELRDEIKRLNELLRSEGANRYWEGRWRDEAAENDRLRAEIKAAGQLGFERGCAFERERCAQIIEPETAAHLNETVGHP